MRISGRLSGTARLVRQSLRAERASSAMLFVLLVVTVALAAGVPALAERAAADGLRAALERATVAERNVVFNRQTDKLIDVVETDDGGIIPAEGDPLAAIERAGAELAAQMPPTIAAAVVDRQYVLETARYLARRAPQSGTHLNLRYQSDVERHIEYVAGRAPTAAVEHMRCPPTGEMCVIGPDDPAVVYETAVSNATAEALKLGVGDELRLMLEVPSPRPRPNVPPTRGDIGFIAVRVTGIYEVLDPAADYWLRDTSLYQPTIQPVSIDYANYFATALVARDTYAELPGQISYTYAWRFTLDPARIDAGALAGFERDLRRLQARHPLRALSGTADSPSLATGLSRILDRYHAQRAASGAALTVVAAGPLVAVGGSLLLVCLLWVGRRQPALLYMRQRGASSGQVLGRALGEAVLIAAPAALLGYGFIELAIGEGAARASLSGAAAATALALLAVVLAVLPSARASLGVAPADQAAGTEARRRRLVLEALVVGLAVVGTVLLTERGATTGSGVDPFLALVPALIGVAAGLLLLRFYPPPIRALAWLARRGRGLIGTHALRSAARETGLARLPLLVVLLAAALVVFSSAVLMTLERGQLAASWQQVGADYRIEARVGDAIPTYIELAEIDGITVQTRALSGTASIGSGRQRRDGVSLLAVEPAEYQALLAGTPAAIGLPDSFGGPWPVVDPRSPAEVGTDERPLPAVVSNGLAGAAGLGRGELFELTIPGGRVGARIDGLRPTLPGLSDAAEFVIVPYPALRAAYPHRPLLPTLLLARGGPEAEAAVTEQVMATQRVRLSNRHALHRRLHEAPLARAISGGLELALAVTLGYGALALAASSVLSLLARRRELALLRTLGVRRRQLLAMLLIDRLPGVAAALAAGVGLGLALAWLLLPALGLEAFTGPGVAISFQLEPSHVLVAVVIPSAVVIGLTLAGGWLIARDDLAAIIRGGEAQAVERR